MLVFNYLRLFHPSYLMSRAFPLPSANTTAPLMFCFTLPYLCKHSCVAGGWVCLCLGVPSFKFFMGKNIGRDSEHCHRCLMPPAGEPPVLLPCLLVQLGSSCAGWRQDTQICQHFGLPPHSRLLSETALLLPHC